MRLVGRIARRHHKSAYRDVTVVSVARLGFLCPWLVVAPQTIPMHSYPTLSILRVMNRFTVFGVLSNRSWRLIKHRRGGRDLPTSRDHGTDGWSCPSRLSVQPAPI